MLAITMGDPNGIGPEIVAGYLKENPAEDILVIGNEKALGFFAPQLKCQVIDPAGELTEHSRGRPLADNGRASFLYIQKAIAMALAGEITAIVTSPLNKEALHLAGYHFDGHTEILAEASGVKKFGMMFWSPAFNVMLTTIHKPLKAVPALITQDRFKNTLELALLGMMQLGVSNPAIAVCGLNPHAGEGGIFGGEEQNILLPVIDCFRAAGHNISDPLPADTAFTPAKIKKYDIFIAHYHDQGLIPLKMAAFDQAVNITLGLPFVRTSVDHGTAYDIAGRGLAHLGSLANAVEIARKIAGNRNL